MCPWVGLHAPSFGRQLWGLPSRVEYLSPQGVLLPLVYGTTASPLWLELRGLCAWQATPSRIVYRLACHGLLLQPVRIPVAIFGSLGVCIYGPASRHWLISCSPIHLT